MISTTDYIEHIVKLFDEDLFLRNGILAIVSFPRPAAYYQQELLAQRDVSKIYQNKTLNDFYSPFLERERVISAINLIENKLSSCSNNFAILVEAQKINNIYIFSRRFNHNNEYENALLQLKNLSFLANFVLVNFWFSQASDYQKYILEKYQNVLVSKIETDLNIEQNLPKLANEYNRIITDNKIVSKHENEIESDALKRKRNCGIIEQELFEQFYEKTLYGEVFQK